MYFFVKSCIVENFRKRRKLWFFNVFCKIAHWFQNLGKVGFHKVFRINAQMGPRLRIRRTKWVFAYILLLSGYKGAKKGFFKVS